MAGPQAHRVQVVSENHTGRRTHGRHGRRNSGKEGDYLPNAHIFQLNLARMRGANNDPHVGLVGGRAGRARRALRYRLDRKSPWEAASGTGWW